MEITCRKCKGTGYVEELSIFLIIEKIECPVCKGKGSKNFEEFLCTKI